MWACLDVKPIFANRKATAVTSLRFNNAGSVWLYGNQSLNESYYFLQVTRTPEELKERLLSYGEEETWKISVDKVKAREFLGKKEHPLSLIKHCDSRVHL